MRATRGCDSLNLLLTGPPRCGKTTVVKAVVEGLRGKVRLAGFVTTETRKGGERVGFDIMTIEGARAPLARKGLSSGPQVGSYRVDKGSLEGVGVPSLFDGDAAAFVLDEIGLMELASPLFRSCVVDLLDDPRPLLATIRSRPHPFCDAVKARPDTELIVVDMENRDGLPGALSTRILMELGHP